MKTNIEYRVINQFDVIYPHQDDRPPNAGIDALQELVNEAIVEGWLPLGGLTMAVDNNASNMSVVLYAQAMVREYAED